MTRCPYIKLNFVYFFQQECGSRLTESGGIITSPDYEYEGTSEDIECTWFIEAKKGQRIRLTFLDFFVDGAVPGQCDSARLQLHDGDTIDAPSLGNVLCDEDSAQEVTSHTRFLTVFFKATSWDFYKFKIEYSFYDAGKIDVSLLYFYYEEDIMSELFVPRNEFNITLIEFLIRTICV